MSDFSIRDNTYNRELPRVLPGQMHLIKLERDLRESMEENAQLREMIAQLDSRERCKDCGIASPCSFHVPDGIWSLVMGEDCDDVVCLNCWDERASRANVAWSQYVKLYPVDRITAAEETLKERLK